MKDKYITATEISQRINSPENKARMKRIEEALTEHHKNMYKCVFNSVSNRIIEILERRK